MPLFTTTDITDWDPDYVTAARDMLFASILYLSGDARAGRIWVRLGLIAWKKTIRELAA